MKKTIKIIFLVCMILIIFNSYTISFAITESDVKSGMAGSSTLDSTTQNNGIMGAINDFIGILQVAGTGIALITVTLLGARYMMAAPEQKADIKQKAIPVVIGMIILFSAVNLVGIGAQLATDSGLNK